MPTPTWNKRKEYGGVKPAVNIMNSFVLIKDEKEFLMEYKSEKKALKEYNKYRALGYGVKFIFENKKSLEKPKVDQSRLFWKHITGKYVRNAVELNGLLRMIFV